MASEYGFGQQYSVSRPSARWLACWAAGETHMRGGLVRRRPGPLEVRLAVALLTYNKVSGSGHARERINGPWNFIRKKSWPHHCKG